MSRLIKICVLWLGAATLLMSHTAEDISGPVPVPQSSGGSLYVVANGKGAPAEMTMSLLKRVLKGEQQRWKGGVKVSLAFMKTSTTTGADMAKRLFGMTEKELNKYFLAQVFQGKMSSPEFFDSEADLISYVKKTEGAIGVVSSSESGGVTAVAVDGKKSF